MGNGYEQGAVPAGQLRDFAPASGETMNRAFAIILVPTLLVVIGYLVVFHSMGVAPPYWLLSLAVILFVGALWWVGRRSSRKAGSGAR